jgi:hypothetical protein
MEITNRLLKQTGEIIMSEMYKIARQLQAPGVRTVATFNPTRLTKTVRNMVRKSIATGIHNGGWYSKTKKVRELVFDLGDVRPSIYVATDADYIVLRTSRPSSEGVVSEIIGLLEADCTLQKMGYDDIDKNKYTPSREEYYKTIDRRHAEHIEKAKAAHINSHTMVVRQANLRRQIAEVFLRDRTVEEIALAEMLASRLDRDEEFAIPTHHNF